MALLGTLTSGVSALKTFGKSLEVIGNNIANVNTTGYKGSTTSFADTLGSTLRAASPTQAGLQVGTGVRIGTVSTNFKQGSLTSTGNATDLAVSGQGYFLVRDSAGAEYATRDGAFHFDTTGRLLNAQNMAVVGSDGNAITAATYPTAASLSIGTDGTITIFAADGTSATGGQVGLLRIADESKLMKAGSNLFDFSATGASSTTDLGAAGDATLGLGRIQSGELEGSNVDLAEQFSDLITSQRSFQAASRLITVSDSVLEDVVNLKR